MSQSGQISTVLIMRAIRLWFQGRVHFDRNIRGDTYRDGGEFSIFRKVIVDPHNKQPHKTGAIFKVRFHFARFSMKANRNLSLIPIPFIVSQPGFRLKTWMFDRKTEEFMGYYEWDTVEDAEKYWDSFPLRLMRKRAVQSSLKHETLEL